MRSINRIIIHCTATREGEHHTVADIDRWHKERGFVRSEAPKDAKYKHIGYHYVVYLDGSVHDGRTEEEKGAHCLNYNAHSIGICYVGGLDRQGKPKDTRTKEQREALIKLLYVLVKKYSNVTIHGHNEFAAKDCPCFDVKNEYKVI